MVQDAMKGQPRESVGLAVANQGLGAGKAAGTGAPPGCMLRMLESTEPEYFPDCFPGMPDLFFRERDRVGSRGGA